MRIVTILLLLLPFAVPAAAQEKIEVDGDYRHDEAGAVFAQRVGEFVRGDVFRYDPGGRDVSATYNLIRPDGRLVMTVYIYPAPAVPAASKKTACRQLFDDAASHVGGGAPGRRTIASGEAPAAAGVRAELGHRAVYRVRARFDGEEQEVRTEIDLYCFAGGDWLVKYRASSNRDMEVEEAIEEFIRTGPWPGRAPADPSKTVAMGNRATAL